MVTMLVGDIGFGFRAPGVMWASVPSATDEISTVRKRLRRNPPSFCAPLCLFHAGRFNEKEKGRRLSRPSGLTVIDGNPLTLDDVNDLVGVRAKNDVPAVHQDKIISAPFRIDFHDARRQ